MTESHDPMCSVPLSYLTMLQERGDIEKSYTSAYRSDSDSYKDDIREGVTPESYERIQAERDEARARIAAFEERAGCKLEQIPVEELGRAQNAYVSQQAIDTLKAQNEHLAKQVNALTSESQEWRGKYREATRGGEPVKQKAFRPKLDEVAPYGFKKDGTPKKRPGRKVPRKRAT